MYSLDIYIYIRVCVAIFRLFEVYFFILVYSHFLCNTVKNNFIVVTNWSSSNLFICSFFWVALIKVSNPELPGSSCCPWLSPRWMTQMTLRGGSHVLLYIN